MNTENPAVKAEFVQYNTTLLTSYVTLNYIMHSVVVENVVEVCNVYIFLYQNVSFTVGNR
jgi:hypothetical protein